MTNGTTDDAFRLAATGDAIVSRADFPTDASDPRFEPVRSALGAADASVTNLECIVSDEQPYATIPRKLRDQYQYQSASPVVGVHSEPWVLDELTDLGVDLFSAANNHSLDFGRQGVESTIRALRERNLPFAGLGRNLAAARAPGYCETPAGRVGLVHTTTSEPAGGAAGAESAFVPGRPGVSPLHLHRTYRVPAERLDQLREIASLVGIEDVKDAWIARENWADDPDLYPFMHMAFEAAADQDDVGIHLSAHPPDREAVLDQVREAAAQAEWVVATIHSHQGPNGARNVPETPDFLVEFAHDCVDAGADAFVCTGPHVLRGIECYAGKPIFYSLGNFVFQNETLHRFPAEAYDTVGVEDTARPSALMDEYLTPEGELGGIFADPEYWMTVVPTCHYDADGRVTRIELLPCSLGRERHRSARGTPRLATEDQQAWVFEALSERSRRFGTTIEREGDRGIVEPA
jgi:poly-gamma-glutamate synthesis protein (capsule biosynthesis protein)